MKVTICCKRFGHTGGAEKFLRNLARCLLEDGHRLKVLAAELRGEMDDIETVPLALPPAPKAFQDLVLARASRKALQAEHADVTFSDQKCWGADVVRPGGGVQREYVKQRIKAFRSPVERTLRRAGYALSIRERLRIHIDDKLYREPGPRLVIANSDMVRRDLERHYRRLSGRIRVVYNGADPQRFHPGLAGRHRAKVRAELDIPDEALVAAFVGTGWRRKGLYTLLEALGSLSRKAGAAPVYGIVVGKGRLRRARAFAARHGAADVVRFVGLAAPEPYYGASDLLALPSFFDPCANVTLEALACGLPVITSVTNGAHELITPGREGFYIQDPADATELAKRIEYFTEPRRLSEASRAARELALGHTLGRQYGEIIEALKEVARGG